jgi:arylsulfatase A-like enzyme
MRSTNLLLIALVSAAGTSVESRAVVLTGSSEVLADRPNLVLIVCDNLGYGDIQPFGSDVHRTPSLVRMARQGMRFTHFYASAGVCTPSRASIMTGCYAQRVGMHTNERDGQVLRPLSPYGLHPREITVAEVLDEAGYVTCLIGKWHLGDHPDFLPRRQGFDEFFGIPYSDDMTQSVGRRLGDRFDGERWPPLPLMENEVVVEAPADRNTLTQRYTQRAIRFIERHRTRRFFLFLSHAMPGSTLTPFASEAFRGKSRNGPWGDAVEELDWSTGQILDALARLDLQHQTLVIWTSDNGAPMTNDPDDPRRGTNRPLAGRGYTTAEGGFRVPTIAWWPGRVPAAAVCHELATTMDFLPTFAQLAGASVPPGRHLDGYDIRPLLLGEGDSRSPYDVFYFYEQAQLQAVRSGPWKLFLPLRQFRRHPHFRRGGDAGPLLFNVVDDPGSDSNVAGQHPEVVKRLSALAEEARRELGDVGRRGTGQRPVGCVLDAGQPTEPKR